MIVWIRNSIIIFIILTIIYFVLSIQARIKRRLKLREEYEDDQPPMDRDEFIETGMKKYNKSLRPKLFLLVYVLPFIIGGFLLFLAKS